MVGGGAFVTEFSAAMAIHTGPGVIGAAWLRQPTDDPGDQIERSAGTGPDA
jgi:hypothetical protein